MTFSRMTALASSSFGDGGDRCMGPGLRKAFQAKRRRNTSERGEMDITLLQTEVCIHNSGRKGRKKDEKQFDRKEILPHLKY